MNISNIKKVVELAKEFNKRAKDVLDRTTKDDKFILVGTKESGALRRISLDLTRALSEMRNK